MKALIYEGPGKIAWEEHSDPLIQQETDAIVKILKTTICGTDLHIIRGDVPSCTRGRILGHEGIGVVHAIGSSVSAFKVGDRVLVSCITSCGKCEYCKKGMYSHCLSGGWILGNTIDGMQADYVCIPYADTSLYPVPKDVEEEALVMLSDVLPTAFECGVLNAKVEPGCTLAIVGSGPVGLAALLTAQFYSPAQIIVIDVDGNRLQVAKYFGATDIIDSKDGKAVETVMQLTNLRGVDSAIEAVGLPTTYGICEDIITAGGNIAILGVHGVKVDLHLERLWSHNVTLRTRLVDTVTTPMLLRTVQSGKIDPRRLITHHFRLSDIMEAYAVFRDAAANHALKVILKA